VTSNFEEDAKAINDWTVQVASSRQRWQRLWEYQVSKITVYLILRVHIIKKSLTWLMDLHNWWKYDHSLLDGSRGKNQDCNYYGYFWTLHVFLKVRNCQKTLQYFKKFLYSTTLSKYKYQFVLVQWFKMSQQEGMHIACWTLLIYIYTCVYEYIIKE
jgi:hypothetical protein